MKRASITRETGETRVEVELCIQGKGQNDIRTGIGLFDHMLCLMSRHGLMDMHITCDGDIDVDSHHTVEDVGIALGQAFAGAMDDKTGIARYGQALLPMDEALAQVAVDVSGRPHVVFDAVFPTPVLGNFETETVEEFFRAFAMNAGITLHARLLYGSNTHHMIEALFKGLGRALRMACEQDPRETGVPSTKGLL